MKYGKIMILSIILAGLLVIGTASAADIGVKDFVSTQDSSNMIGSEVNTDLSSKDTNNHLTVDEKSFSQLNQPFNEFYSDNENYGDVLKDGSSHSSDLDQTDSNSNFNKSNSECCSFVIQEENETIFAFRQDSPLNGYGVTIHNDSYDGLQVIVQEIDTPGRHFIHAIVTEDGWVASHGGDSTNSTHIKNLETLAIEMLVSKNILPDSLAKIQKEFNDLFEGYGHFFIKAPDGRYGIVFGETCLYGTLKPGEFIIIPNVYYGFRMGNYSDYGINPVDAIIEICSYENTGWNRRNLYTYDYKAFDTANGQKYGVDIYVTDDNGINVGLNTSKIVTYCYFNDVLYPLSSIPQYPDKLHITTYIFENQSIDSVFEVVNSPKNVLVNSNALMHYRINNIVDERTVEFDLDENVEFINALVSQGSYSYDSTLHKLFWDLNSTDSSKEIMLNIRPKTKGVHNIRSHVGGIGEEFELTFYATDSGVVLTADNVTTYKTYYKSLDVYLTDGDGVPLIGEKVSIMVGGAVYYREVTPKGYASFNIILQPGEYDAIISYYGDLGTIQTTAKIIVEKTLFTEDLVVSYEDASTFNIFCLDENGTALPKAATDIRIDGVLKTIYTDDEGFCKFDISKLGIGNHTITSFNGRTNEIVTNVITIVNITKTELKVNPVTTTYNINKNLVITLTSSKGILEGVAVNVKVGSISKTIKTNSKGQVSVDISSLVPKNSYTATITFNGNSRYYKSTATAKVTVKKATPKLTAKAKTFKRSDRTKKYTIILKTNKNKVMKNTQVKITVNKKTYSAKTNSKGQATFKLTKLTKTGKYTAVVKYGGNKYYTAKTVKPKIVVK